MGRGSLIGHLILRTIRSHQAVKGISTALGLIDISEDRAATMVMESIDDNTRKSYTSAINSLSTWIRENDEEYTQPPSDNTTEDWLLLKTDRPRGSTSQESRNFSLLLEYFGESPEGHYR
jgi:hypothetical protein